MVRYNLLMLAVLLGTVGCNNQHPVGAGTCLHKGVTYQDQQEWMDDCNTCWCNFGGGLGVTCTLADCADAGSDAGDDRRCVYKGVSYQDQQEWWDDCNRCKCNEGHRGVVCTLVVCSDAGVDSVSPFFSCGESLCKKGSQVCIHPCCGGAAPRCTPKPDGGVCPAGTRDGCSGGQDGCEATCTPDPPYCADEAPVGCHEQRDRFGNRQAACTCA